MDPVELELDPAIAGSLMEAAHGQRRSVKRGDAVETVMQCSGVAAAVLPVTGCAPLLDRSRVSRWGVWLRRTSYREPPTLPLFNAQCDGGPPAIDGLGAPDQGARSRPKWPLGHCGWEIKPTPLTR